jgi:hypothetical protein
MIYPHEDMSLDDLCAVVHRQGTIWLNNHDLLLLEELIRRAKACERARRDAGAKGDHHDRRHQPVRDVPAPAGADVRGQQTSEPAGDRSGGGLTEAEIKEIESYASGAFASLVGEGG